MEPTLHRLLWGPTPHKRLAEWAPRPWEVPAVGLPVRVAALLYASASQSGLPPGWSPAEGPLTWRLAGQGGSTPLDHEKVIPTDVITRGRLSQFDLDPPCAPSGGASPDVGATSKASSGPTSKGTPCLPLVVRRTTAWEVPPHEAYFLPFCAAREITGIESADYALYCDVLLLITAIDGGEAILTGLAERGVGSVPFVDRWAWRSRIHLPEPAWEAIDSILRWSGRPENALADPRRRLSDALEPLRPNELTSDDFERERVDIGLGGADSTEIARAVGQMGVASGNLPPELRLDETKLEESLLLRVGQALGPAESPEAVLSAFPAVESRAGNVVLEQIASAFQAPHHGSSGRTPDLVVFPELAVPEPEARTVRDLVAKTGIASLSGLYWRQLKPVYAPRGSACPSRSWFVNEAEFAVPVGQEDPGPTSVRWYRVRKPLPAHVEAGLASALSCRKPGRKGVGTGARTQWAMLKGQRWYRFLHPDWGDFTVAICADLLDAAPWHSLRGEIMHLFMVACNQDVGLFDALTWVRSYENFANVVTVNDGRYGGTVLWTPKRGSHRRELGHVRGSGLSVIADVRVPVKSLFRQQKCGIDEAVQLSKAEWLPKSPEQGKFKAPPPGFERRALSRSTDVEGT